MWNISAQDENFSSALPQVFTETFNQSRYEVKVLASLCSDKCLNSASLSCASSPGYVALTLENKLSVFKDETQELFWEKEFGSKCGCISLSTDFLLAVEQPGTLHLLHLPSSKAVWSSDLEHNGSFCTVQNAFISSNSPGSLSVYVYTKEDILFETSTIDLSALFEALEHKKVSEFFRDISVKKIDLANMLPDYSIKSMLETHCKAFPVGLEVENKPKDFSHMDGYAIADMVDGDFDSCNFLSDWELEDDERKYLCNFTGYGEMKRIICTRDNRYIICLDEKGQLLIFSSITQLHLKTWGDGDIKDFVLYDTLDSETLSVLGCKIGILRKYNNNHIFEVIEFPSFDFVHKIQLSGYVSLVESKPNQDSWYVLDGDQSNSGNSLLKLISISETRPETRLLSLLNRRKFKQAEKYAKLCNLDDEIIFKTKISCMLKDSLNPDVANLTQQDVAFLWKEVEECLSKIKDLEFIKSCISLLVPEMEVMRKFFTSIHNWLIANDIHGAEDLISEVNKNENKLTTYNELPESIRSNLSIKEFLKKDLLQFLKSELISGGLSTALIIWQRHKNEILSSLTIDHVGEVLNAIPDDIPSNRLISFLENDFLPPVLSKLPKAVGIIADWIVPRIYLMEIIDKNLWPENGNKLASMFLELVDTLHKRAGKGGISFSKSVSLAYSHRKLINTDSQAEGLFELSKNLKLLISLKENFNCKISLTAFQESKMDVIFAVLDRINLKFISKAVSEFAQPYALENDLDLDLCLELYIKNTISTSYYTWWSLEEAPWEECLTLVLECIQNSSHWINAALFIVSHASVPWSNKVRNIVEQGLNSDHPRQKEFHQAKQVCLKELLVKYEIRDFPMHNNSRLVHTLVCYILKQNKPSALDDAKRVYLCFNESLTNEHYKKFLQFYLNQNKLTELVALHSSLPTNIAVEVSNNLLRYIGFGLDDSYLIEYDKESIDTFLSAGIYFIEFLKSKKQPVDVDLLNTFRSMKKLQKEFGLSVTLTDMADKQNALRIVETFVGSFLNEEESNKHGEKKSLSVPKGIFKTKRLGCILNIEEENIMAVLVTNCLQRKKYDLVIKLCGELIASHPSSQNAKTLLKVVNHFIENFENIKNLSFETIIATVCHLSNLAVTCCDSEMIQECMYAAQLSTYLTVLNKITGQQLLLSQASVDNYHKWKFCPVYEDEGFQLDISQVVDFVQKLIPLFWRKRINLKQAIDFPMQEIYSLLFKPIINQMKNNGQTITALRTMYLFYHLQTEFVQTETSAENASMLIVKDVRSVAFTIIQRMIDKRKLDMELSIGLLSIYQNEQIKVLEMLQKWSTKDLRSLLSFGEVGSECCRVLENPTKCVEYDKFYQRALLLFKHNVKYTEIDVMLNSNDSDYNWDVVKDIVLSPKTTLTTIFETCSAFDLVTDHVMIAYLNSIILEAEKIFLTNIEIPEEDLQLMLNRAKCAIDAIVSEELIVKNLENLLKNISSYSYEILLFIHEQILRASANIITITSSQFKKSIALLNFLRVYQRVTPPGEIELESWISKQPTGMKFPALAKKRLPFWTIFEDNVFKIINPELTANTFKVWLPIAPSLKISKDSLIMVAVKNHVMAYLKKLPTQYLIINPDEAFLHNIRDMLINISDPESSVACASWVANRMPPGGNKEFACVIAMKLAENWRNVCPNERNPIEILQKSSLLYRRSAVEGILYRNNVANDMTLSYVHNPFQLAEYLIEEYCSSVESSIKVCKSLSQIAEVVGLSLEDIFSKFFLKWLNVTQDAMNNLDESFNINNSLDGQESEDSNEENIFRSINLILGASTIGLDICATVRKNYSKMSVIQRSRFVYCTAAVYGLQYVAESLDMSPDSLEENFPKILYFAELEYLHLLYSKEMTSRGNVLELVHSIICNQSNNPKAILCCVRICLEHNIWKSEVWDILLQRLISMSRIESLHDILQTTQGHLIHMWHYKSFISAWNSIILSSFESESTDFSTIIERIYKTVLGCPCLNALDIESLWNDFKYFIKSLKEIDLEHKEPVSDASAFISVLKCLRENC